MTSRISILLPLLLVAGLVAVFVYARPFDQLSQGVPAAEELTVEATQLDDAGIHLSLRAAGSEPMTVAQVQVDGAYRVFSQSPTGPIGYLQSADITIPYPWVSGETHNILFVTSTGATFEHTIDIAIQSPGTQVVDLVWLALVGLFVGVVPILIGFAFYPSLLSFGAAGRDFALALTVGLLTFLLIDTSIEGLEIASNIAGGLKGDMLFWLSALMTTLALLAIGRRSGRPPEGVQLALFIAIGIGAHNLGEGLAIGASFASGEIALASFLVLGFALHNVTEGIAISAPIQKSDLSPSRLAGLALIAGGPAILGTMTGGLALAPIWNALAFGIGAGAILQVIIEIVGLFARRAQDDLNAWFSRANMTGFGLGIVVMYATALLVRA